ncbi:hypothetical protein A2U01_0076008, partial [Trifolium medium]|nr:hypothetical protein [Trifolium medium]
CTPGLQLSTLDQMVVVANPSSRRCCSCKPSSLTRIQNTVCDAGCAVVVVNADVEDEVKVVLLLPVLLPESPCRHLAMPY